MRASLSIPLVLLLFAATMTPPARGQTHNRPLRVGNINLLLLGAGVLSFDHPNYDAHAFPNLAYQRRILRRESRFVHLWLRGAVNFTSEDRKLYDTFSVWVVPLHPGTIPGPDTVVSESTSDFTVRTELAADLWRTPYSAVYAAGGFALHYMTFNSRGCGTGPGQCYSNSFETNANVVAPSLAVGGRVFAAKRPYTGYVELRFGRVNGKTDSVPLNEDGKRYLTSETFEFTTVDAMSIEGGVGLHW